MFSSPLIELFRIPPTDLWINIDIFAKQTLEKLGIYTKVTNHFDENDSGYGALNPIEDPMLQPQNSHSSLNSVTKTIKQGLMVVKYLQNMRKKKIRKMRAADEENSLHDGNDEEEEEEDEEKYVGDGGGDGEDVVGVKKRAESTSSIEIQTMLQTNKSSKITTVVDSDSNLEKVMNSPNTIANNTDNVSSRRSSNNSRNGTRNQSIKTPEAGVADTPRNFNAATSRKSTTSTMMRKKSK